MCTFSITNDLEHDFNVINAKLKLGGPDYTGRVVENNIALTHNLLSCTGVFTPQPIITDRYICMLLGEIYNFKSFENYSSDVDCIIPLYEKYGWDFHKQLDGEFVVIIYDKHTNNLMFFSDPFATRQVWAGVSKNKFYFSTYLDYVSYFVGKKNIISLEPNQGYEFDCDTYEWIRQEMLHEWKFEQNINSLDNWDEALHLAVKKRYPTDRTLAVLLSGGGDSSSLALALANQGLSFESFSMDFNPPAEDKNTFDAVIKKINQPNTFLTIDQTTQLNAVYHAWHNIPETIINKKVTSQFRKNGAASGTAFGVGQLYKSISNKRIKICLDGHGSDEIIADYSDKKNVNTSVHEGYWPDDLKSVFPWTNFYGGMQRVLLNKNEVIALSFGIELRHPILDRYLVQEWLSLSPKIKNLEGKSPIKNYLRNNNIPIPTVTVGLARYSK